MENADPAGSAALAAAEAATPTIELIEELPPRASPSQAVSLLINAAVGAGVLALPFGFRCAGYLGGPLILASVAIIESFTLYVLSKWAEKTNAASYGELVLRSAGPATATALCVVIFLYLFGSGVAYLVILGDCFHPLVSKLLGTTWYTTRKAVIATTGTAFVLPMCFAESLSAAAGISGVNFVAFLLVVVAIIGRSVETLVKTEHPFEGAQAFSPSWGAAIPIAVFGLQCHAQVVAVFNELRDSSVVSGNGTCVDDVAEEQEESETDVLIGNNVSIGRSVVITEKKERKRKKRSVKLVAMTKVIITAIAITAVGYALVGLLAYLAYPTQIESNVLKTFPHDDPIIQIVRAVVGLIEIASYPVNHLPARQAVKDAVSTATGLQLGGKAFLITETVLFYIGTLILALVVNDLGSVFALTGGICGSAIILGMPGLLLIQYSWNKQQKTILVSRNNFTRVDLSTRQVASYPLLSSLLEEGERDEDEGQQHRGQAGLHHQDYHPPAAAAATGVATASEAGYTVWRSKLFWSGCILILSCVTLMVYTIVATVLSKNLH